MDIKSGRTYVIRVVDDSNIAILHEYTKREMIVSKAYPIIATSIKIILVLVSILIPLLLFMTIPLLRRSRNV